MIDDNFNRQQSSRLHYELTTHDKYLVLYECMNVFGLEVDDSVTLATRVIWKCDRYDDKAKICIFKF